MKVLICGIDGYIGWPLAKELSSRGHHVVGLDNFSRRKLAKSAIPLGQRNEFEIEIADLSQTCPEVKKYDTIINLAHQPSAPWSMKDRSFTVSTFQTNVIGTINLLWWIKRFNPQAHLVTIGSMGEYGTPATDIPDNNPDFPRHPGSFYHASKVANSVNIRFACETWGLRATDIMQGIVYGTRADKATTRFDFDECFGTVVNRFCAQTIIGMKPTVYGTGGQIRSFLPLRDSIQCICLLADNPPVAGEYRIVNQFHECCSINNLAHMIAEPQYIQNPRTEAETHYYKPQRTILDSLGYKPTGSLETEIPLMLNDLIPWKSRIEKRMDGILPEITWLRA